MLWLHYRRKQFLYLAGSARWKVTRRYQPGRLYLRSLISLLPEMRDKVAEPVQVWMGEESEEEEPGARPRVTNQPSFKSPRAAQRVAVASWRPAGLGLLALWVLFSVPRLFLLFQIFSPCNLFLASLPPWRRWPLPGRGTVRLFLPPVSLVLRIYSIMLAAPSVSIKHVSVQCLGFKPSGEARITLTATCGPVSSWGDPWHDWRENG